MKLFQYLIFIAMCLGMNGCQDASKDIPLYFIGDSIIARWDLDESFPSRMVYNYGKSGAGIDYLQTLSGKFIGRNIVVMIGTNDNTQMTDTQLQEYAKRYLNAVNALGASRIYLYSVLPRDFETDRKEVNTSIEAFNSVIKRLVASNHNIIYLNVFGDFLYDGRPNPQLYSDGLHLSTYGYEVLSKALDKKL